MTSIGSVTSITATSARLSDIAGYTGDGILEIQYSTRPDFSFCVCPTFTAPYGGYVVMDGLNQRTTYYARIRTRQSNGTVEAWSDPPTGFRTSNGPAQNVAPAVVMISPSIIVKPERPLSISSANTLAGFPVENLLIDSPVAWRNAGGYSFVFQTAGQPIDTIALLNTNCAEAATLTVTAGPNQNLDDGSATFVGSFPARASPNLPGRPGYHGLIALPAARTDRWWRVALGTAGPTGGVFHAEHLVVGLNRVSKSYGGEKSEQAVPLTTITRTRSGIVDRVRGWPMRRVEFELSNLTEAQFETLYSDLWRYENEPFLVVPNGKPGSFLHDRMLYGELSGGRAVTPSTVLHNRNLIINSII